MKEDLILVSLINKFKLYKEPKNIGEIIVSRIDDEGNNRFEIQYNNAITELEFDSTVRDFPTIQEIEAFCEGVDAGYESIFDFLPEDLNGYSFQKLQNEFNDLPSVLKSIDKGKLYRNARGKLIYKEHDKKEG